MTAEQRKALRQIQGWWKQAAPALGVKGSRIPRIHFVAAGQGWTWTQEDPDGILAIYVGPGAVRQAASDNPKVRDSVRYDFFHEFTRMYQSLAVWDSPSSNAGSGTANGFANRLTRKVNGKKGANPKKYARKHFPDFGKDPQTITLAGKTRMARASSAPKRKPKGRTRRRGKVVKEMGLRNFLMKLGLSEDQVDALDQLDIEKAGPVTFAERMAQRELDDELPDAMSVLRSCVFWAFNPPPGENVDAKQVISQSLDEFKTWALGLVDRVDSTEVQKQIKATAKVEDAVKKAARFGLEKAKAESPKSDFAKVGDVELDDIIGSETETDDRELSERVEDLEKAVSRITPENIAKAMKDHVAKETPGSGDGEGGESGDGDGEGETGDGGSQAGRQPVTKEDLRGAIDKIVDEASEQIEKLQSQITKLGEGGSSQSADEIEKEQTDRVQKAMEAEGFKPEDAKALGGIFN